jgi:hypothetical protein
MPLVCFSLLFATDTLIAILMCWILYNNRTEYAECVTRTRQTTAEADRTA